MKSHKQIIFLICYKVGFDPIDQIDRIDGLAILQRNSLNFSLVKYSLHYQFQDLIIGN